MIRERRNKEKLTSYYNKFVEEGIIDPNVHPWVAESWRRCEARKLNHETMPSNGVRLSPQELEKALEVHEDVVKYVDGLFEQNKQYFNSHNLSMLLVDEDGYVLKNYALPFSSGASRISRACGSWRRMWVLPASVWPGATMCPS